MYFEFNSNPSQVFLGDCTIVERSRNFAGLERRNKYGDIVNSAGRRNFLIELDPDTYEVFKEKGLNVGRFAPRDGEEESNGFLRINVSYFKKDPVVTMVSEGVETLLTEDRIHILDDLNIEHIDVLCDIVNKQNKRTGEWTKQAFVDSIRVEVIPNHFAEKYAYLHNGGARE